MPDDTPSRPPLVVLDALQGIAVSTNDGGEYLKLTCKICRAETYVKLPTNLRDLTIQATSHTHI